MGLRREWGSGWAALGVLRKATVWGWLISYCLGSWSRIGAGLPEMFLGVAEAWLPVPLWPVLGSNTSTITMYKLCDLQQVP